MDFRESLKLSFPQTRHHENFLLGEFPLHGIGRLAGSAGDLEWRLMDAAVLPAEGEIASLQAPAVASVRGGRAHLRQVGLPSTVSDQCRQEASGRMSHELEGRHGDHEHFFQSSHRATCCMLPQQR